MRSMNQWKSTSIKQRNINEIIFISLHLQSQVIPTKGFAFKFQLTNVP